MQLLQREHGRNRAHRRLLGGVPGHSRLQRAGQAVDPAVGQQRPDPSGRCVRYRATAHMAGVQVLRHPAHPIHPHRPDPGVAGWDHGLCDHRHRHSRGRPAATSSTRRTRASEHQRGRLGEAQGGRARPRRAPSRWRCPQTVAHGSRSPRPVPRRRAASPSRLGRVLTTACATRATVSTCRALRTRSLWSRARGYRHRGRQHQ